MTRSIGGTMNLEALAALAGKDHRREPPDQANAAAAAADLRRQGLTIADIAQALRIGEAAVRQLLPEEHGHA
jgi:hypothetical protein